MANSNAARLADSSHAHSIGVSCHHLRLLKELGIDGVGRTRWPLRSLQSEPRTSVSVVGVVTTGQLDLTTARRCTTLKRGHAYLVPAGSTAAWRQRGSPSASVWVTYLPGPRNPLAPLHEPVERGGGIALAAAVDELCREFYGRGRLNLLAHWAGAVDAVARALAESAGMHPDLENLWQQVAAEPARRWRVAELARKLGVTRQHFCSLCRAQLGRSPMQELLRLRMEHAATMLAATEVPIARVGLQVSYDDPFAFSRAFKNYFGISPLPYRQKRR